MGIREESKSVYDEVLCTESSEEFLIGKYKLFKDNEKLVGYIAKKFLRPYNTAIGNEDIIQEGYKGLWKACLRFDESKGYEFSTYAVPLIRGEILSMLRDGDLIRAPRWYADIRSALKKHNFTLPLTEMEMDILIQEGKISRAQLLSYEDLTTVSLDAPLNEDEGGDFYNYAYNDEDLIKVEMSDEDIEKIVDKILGYMKPMYRDIIEEWMYATLSGCTLVQSDLARKYKLTQATISRILRSCISITQMHREEILDMLT